MKPTSASTLSSALLAISAFASPPAFAGPYTDDLSKCLVSKTTSSDKSTLITWMFSAIALNPAVADMSTITPDQRTKINSNMAKLFETLMTDTCKSEAQVAYKYEGDTAIETSFSVLGEVAGRELFASPEVSKGMSELDSLIDKKKLESVFGAKRSRSVIPDFLRTVCGEASP